MFRFNFSGAVDENACSNSKESDFVHFVHSYIINLHDSHDTRAELLALQNFFDIQNATVLVNGCLCVLYGQEFVVSYESYDEFLHDCDGGSNKRM